MRNLTAAIFMGLLIFLLAIAIGGCARVEKVDRYKIILAPNKSPPKIVYRDRPSKKCPQLPHLSEDAGQAQITAYLTTVISMYKECTR